MNKKIGKGKGKDMFMPNGGISFEGGLPKSHMTGSLPIGKLVYARSHKDEHQLAKII
jgi:hypothetical protein